MGFFIFVNNNKQLEQSHNSQWRQR